MLDQQIFWSNKSLMYLTSVETSLPRRCGLHNSDWLEIRQCLWVCVAKSRGLTTSARSTCRYLHL